MRPSSVAYRLSSTQKKGPIPLDQAIAGEWNGGAPGYLARPEAVPGDVSRRPQYVGTLTHWEAILAQTITNGEVRITNEEEIPPNS